MNYERRDYAPHFRKSSERERAVVAGQIVCATFLLGAILGAVIVLMWGVA